MGVFGNSQVNLVRYAFFERQLGLPKGNDKRRSNLFDLDDLTRNQPEAGKSRQTNVITRTDIRNGPLLAGR